MSLCLRLRLGQLVVTPVISDVQVIPPRPAVPRGEPKSTPVQGDGSWSQAVGSGKRSRRRARRSNKEQNTFAVLQKSQPVAPRPGVEYRTDSGASDSEAVKSAANMTRSSTKKIKTRRAPRTAVVSIRRESGGPTYASLLRKTREGVALNNLGISGTRIRWSANGAALIEISGPDKYEKAELLAAEVGEVLSGEAVVTRPVASGELYIRGFDESNDFNDVVHAIVDSGGCSSNNVTIGSINKMANGLCSVWSRCPLMAAIKIAELGNLRIGWSLARVTLQQARPIQCFRCWGYGHVSVKYKPVVDRSGACFRCGKENHPASSCSAALFCVVCSRAALPEFHRMGSAACKSVEIARGSQTARGNDRDRTNSAVQMSP